MYVDESEFDLLALTTINRSTLTRHSLACKPTDHEVRLNLLFSSAAEMALNGVDSTVTPEATLYATYVYLDSAERKRFSQNSHEYLITVLQHTGPESIAPGTTSKTANYRVCTESSTTICRLVPRMILSRLTHSPTRFPL